MTSGLFDQFAQLFDRALPHLQRLLVGGDVVTVSVAKARA